jgi:CheY-like chemotaxis protein
VKTVLVVDDDEAIRKFVHTALAKRGWSVLEAEDGVDGTARCILHGPDVLLTDISMPKGDGLEMLAVLRAGDFLGDMRVVIMSGVLGVDDPRLTSAEAAAFLSKPFSLQDLYKAVDG